MSTLSYHKRVQGRLCRETRRDTLSRENGMVEEGAGRRASDSNARTRLTARVQDVDHRREVESQDPSWRSE
jgi:hypothetical protein